jgi:glutamine amidotransferase-like uncharacterized protein
MGMECPVCGLHGGFVHAITATGEMAKKSTDIIARKLTCGHVVGSQVYMQYREQLQALENTAAEKKIAIEEALKSKKTALWATINKSVQET